MSLTGLLTMPCTIYHRTPGAKDEYGDATLSEGGGVSTLCELQQVSTLERGSGGASGRRLEVSRWLLFLPADQAGLQAEDEVEVAGVRYQVDGEPWPVHDPRHRSVHHLEAYLRRVG